ncbi:unnamed protein product [Penicillium salamii]|nr:unnamed protein product [Penicillium salamii]
MYPWFCWLYWLNPFLYGFEVLMGNEFYLKHMLCVGLNLVPHGDGYLIDG